MSDPQTTPEYQSQSPQRPRSFAKKLELEEALVLTLIALSAIGIGITNFMPVKSFWFWASMVPVFGIVSVVMGWSKARRRGEGISRIIRVQLLHWIGLLAAVFLIFFLYDPAGRINDNDLALVMLLALALATFLAGVHFDWRFLIVGVILGATLAGAAFVEPIIWQVVLPLAVALGVVVFWRKRSD